MIDKKDQRCAIRVSVVIPAINEEVGIRQVLAAIPYEFISEVIIVDGGSIDETPNVARSAGARVIDEPRPGYGRACATGVSNATGEIVIFMDADGADDPRLIPLLLSPIHHGGADLVLGSRIAGKIKPGAMPWHQQFGNRLSAWSIRWLYRLPITDLSPFRAIIRQKLLDLDMREMTYGWPTEMIVKAARRGLSIEEIPIDYYPRVGGKSKISGTLRGTVLATYHIFSTILRYMRA